MFLTGMTICVRFLTGISLGKVSSILLPGTSFLTSFIDICCEFSLWYKRQSVMKFLTGMLTCEVSYWYEIWVRFLV